MQPGVHTITLSVETDSDSWECWHGMPASICKTRQRVSAVRDGQNLLAAALVKGMKDSDIAELLSRLKADDIKRIIM